MFVTHHRTICQMLVGLDLGYLESSLNLLDDGEQTATECPHSIDCSLQYKTEAEGKGSAVGICPSETQATKMEVVETGL